MTSETNEKDSAVREKPRISGRGPDAFAGNVEIQGGRSLGGLGVGLLDNMSGRVEMLAAYRRCLMELEALSPGQRAAVGPARRAPDHGDVKLVACQGAARGTRPGP
ncbi:MAG: hypothetical protein LBQ12_09155 [Deltaproteobacteria bacterium]|jgi:hypothetical protein|nr:hypothetical protein [Deltaproteobacteria bacterium]